MLYNVLLIIQVMVALGIIGLVLIQHGKGADAGAAFGGGASGTVFGSRGSGNFLTKLTTILVIVFFANSLMLAWLIAHPERASGESSIVPTSVTEPAEESAPPAPSVPADIPADSSDEPVAPASSSSTPSDVPQ